MRVRPRKLQALAGADPGGAELARWSAASGFLAVIPCAVMAGVALADLLTGPGIGLLPLLCLGPALAAVSGRPVNAVPVGCLALVLCVVLGSYDSLLDHRRGVIALVTVAGTTAAAVIASAGRQQRERELASVRAVAEAAQRVVLRPVPDDLGPVRGAVRYISAAAAARIGGDLYEVIISDGTVRLIVGDVQGRACRQSRQQWQSLALSARQPMTHRTWRGSQPGSSWLWHGKTPAAG